MSSPDAWDEKLSRWDPSNARGLTTLLDAVRFRSTLIYERESYDNHKLQCFFQGQYEFSVPSAFVRKASNASTKPRQGSRRGSVAAPPPLWHFDYAHPDTMHWACMCSDDDVTAFLSHYDVLLPAELCGDVSVASHHGAPHHDSHLGEVLAALTPQGFLSRMKPLIRVT